MESKGGFHSKANSFFTQQGCVGHMFQLSLTGTVYTGDIANLTSLDLLFLYFLKGWKKQNQTVPYFLRSPNSVHCFYFCLDLPFPLSLLSPPPQFGHNFASWSFYPFPLISTVCSVLSNGWLLGFLDESIHDPARNLNPLEQGLTTVLSFF